MTREEIIQVCDLYAQGINELSKLTSQQGHSEELAELLNAKLKSKEDGFNYTHDWIKQYVLNNSQINDNGKELLYVANQTAERTKKEVISKACEWLENTFIDICDLSKASDNISIYCAYKRKSDLITEFRKAIVRKKIYREINYHECIRQMIDFYHKHLFDYRGLLTKG